MSETRKTALDVVAEKLQAQDDLRKCAAERDRLAEALRGIHNVASQAWVDGEHWEVYGDIAGTIEALGLIADDAYANPAKDTSA